MSVYFKQLPDFINAKILYQFKGLQHPTALLIKNIITEIECYDEYEQATIEYYNDRLENGEAQPGHLIDNKVDFFTAVFWYKDILWCGSVPKHITCTWAEYDDYVNINNKCTWDEYVNKLILTTNN